MDKPTLKALLLQRDAGFWDALRGMTRSAIEFDELFFLSMLRKRALEAEMQPPEPMEPCRIALLGGCSLYPLNELLRHLLAVENISAEIHKGDYDNYVSEMTEEDGGLAEFAPRVICLLPSPHRCRHTGPLNDPEDIVQAEADQVTAHLLELCRVAHDHFGSEIILGNFPLPARHDPGPFRSRSLATDWNFRKWVNLQLGLRAPAFVHPCDLEFLSARRGGIHSEDSRGWFESKQPGSPGLLVDIAREIAHQVQGLRVPPKKVLALDLDNTLWGGVIGDDGIEGIEIGDTSPRGEAFKAFQRHILTLKQRGVILAACSKNDHARAIEPFEKHPEMLLQLDDFVSFQANWEPKSDNLRRIAAELNLGLDSFVFADDNPAEIEIVRQFAPEVTTLLLGPDPADYPGQLQDGRWFDIRSLTAEDSQRTAQYRAEAARRSHQADGADMGSYLESLQMEATVSPFTAIDVPRLFQLINKSNQFNLTTRRRTEAEVESLIGNPDAVTLAVRLSDRFGEHGLISIVIGHQHRDTLDIDTWLMSCRVLKREVEQVVLNEIARQAADRGCQTLRGTYLPTPKNEMVRDFYPTMGFQQDTSIGDSSVFILPLNSFVPKPTRIHIHSTQP
jgi:FkbH-like protein